MLLGGWSPAGQPARLQLARDGRWEDAVHVPMPVPERAARAVLAGAGDADADLAVEVEWLGTPVAFVGARRGRESDVEAFAHGVVRAVGPAPWKPAAALAALAGGAPSLPAEIELGAANAWRSVGPLRLWTGGEGRAPGDIASLLGARPELAVCRVPVALEVAFAAPRSCWVGVEVSERTPAGHAVSASRVAALLDGLLAG